MNTRIQLLAALVSLALVAHAAPPASSTTPAPQAVSNAPAAKAAEPVAAPAAAAGASTTYSVPLPKPMFAGTPATLKTSNLEPARKLTGKQQFQAPAGCVNLAAGKPVTSSDTMPVIGELEMVTDGVKDGTEGSYVELGPGLQQVTIDLGKPAELHAIALWHFHSQARVYRDIIIQLADDPDFIENVRTVYNSDVDNSGKLGKGTDFEYIETYEGRLIPLKGEKARYVRLYSNGSTSGDQNHYTEVEVYGIEGK